MWSKLGDFKQFKYRPLSSWILVLEFSTFSDTAAKLAGVTDSNQQLGFEIATEASRVGRQPWTVKTPINAVLPSRRRHHNDLPINAPHFYSPTLPAVITDIWGRYCRRIRTRFGPLTNDQFVSRAMIIFILCSHPPHIREREKDGWAVVLCLRAVRHGVHGGGPASVPRLGMLPRAALLVRCLPVRVSTQQSASCYTMSLLRDCSAPASRYLLLLFSVRSRILLYPHLRTMLALYCSQLPFCLFSPPRFSANGPSLDPGSPTRRPTLWPV